MPLNDPVPSTALDVAKRNASDFDSLLQQESGTVETRTGKQLIPWQVAMQRYAAYNNTGAWVTGTAYQVNDLWESSGTWYVVLTAYTSGATAGDDIASGNVQVWQVRDFVSGVDTIADLRALEPLFDGQQVQLLGKASAGFGGGAFYADFSDTTSSDDGDRVLVTTDGRRWKRKKDLVFGDDYYHVLSGCVVRNDGSGWAFIDDVNHAPFLFNSIDTNVTEQYALTVHRSEQSDVRISASVSPDETLSLVGLCAGASVNDDNIRIKMSAPLSSAFSVSTSPSLLETSSFHESHTSVSWDATNKFFQYDHLATGLSGQPQVSYNIRANTAVEEPFLPGVMRVDNTRNRIAQYMDLTIYAQYNGTDWDINNREIGRNSGSATGYSVSFASQTFTVTHPEIATRVFDDDVTISFYGDAGNTQFYVGKILRTASRTSVTFQVYDISAGAILSSVPTSFAFTMKRGMYRVPRPLGGHLSISLPNTRIDPADVESSTGNIWINSNERYD